MNSLLCKFITTSELPEMFGTIFCLMAMIFGFSWVVSHVKHAMVMVMIFGMGIVGYCVYRALKLLIVLWLNSPKKEKGK